MQAKEGDLHLRKIVGIDLDAAAVRRAVKRICTRDPGIFQGKAAPELELFQADVACEAASCPGSRPTPWCRRVTGMRFPRRDSFMLMDGALSLKETRHIVCLLFEQSSNS